MRGSVCQESRQGKRLNNEDRTAYTWSREALLMVVADGMGGHPYGEVASQVAVESFTSAFEREARERLDDPRAFLLTTMLDAHRAILDHARTRGLTEAPRTTCVACVVQDSVAFWAHVGDSRLYHLRQGRVLAHTRDHSRVQLLVDQGYIEAAAAASHPDRNKIFNCLGSTTPPQAELSRGVPLEPGDVLLLCTDGVWGQLSAGAIARLLAGTDLMRAIPKLLDAAEERAGLECDNLSAVAMLMSDAGRAKPSRKAEDRNRDAAKRERSGAVGGSDIGPVGASEVEVGHPERECADKPQ